jgi:P-type Cu2+ transporter
MLEHSHQPVGSVSKNAVLEVAFKNCHNASDQANLETRLSKLEGVKNVHLDRTRAVAHLSYDPSITTPQKLEAGVKVDGYLCACQDCKGSQAQPGHPSVATHDHSQHPTAPMMDHSSLNHVSSLAINPEEIQPSKTIPSTNMDHSSLAGMDHSKMSGMDHSKMDQAEHAGHGSPDDMFRRFLISLVLTLPIVIFSPIGAALGLPSMPPFGISMGILLRLEWAALLMSASTLIVTFNALLLNGIRTRAL